MINISIKFRVFPEKNNIKKKQKKAKPKPCCLYGSRLVGCRLPDPPYVWVPFAGSDVSPSADALKHSNVTITSSLGRIVPFLCGTAATV